MYTGNSCCRPIILIVSHVPDAEHCVSGAGSAPKQFLEILRCMHVVIDSTSCSSLFVSYLADPETSSPVLVESARTTISGVVSETEGPLAPTGPACICYSNDCCWSPTNRLWFAI